MTDALFIFLVALLAWGLTLAAHGALRRLLARREAEARAKHPAGRRHPQRLADARLTAAEQRAFAAIREAEEPGWTTGRRP